LDVGCVWSVGIYAARVNGRVCRNCVIFFRYYCVYFRAGRAKIPFHSDGFLDAMVVR
jgi:hypothetical protein